ncbi:MAG: element excision factor XisH family protein [Bacteroidota bacterium]
MAKDKYHDLVKTALEADGWTITDDPLVIEITNYKKLQIDLAAEKLLIAQKGKEEIAVEVKSFVGISTLHEFYKALGQFLFYELALKKEMPEKTLYLAVPSDVYRDFFTADFVEELLANQRINLLIYNVLQKSIDQWIKKTNTKES